MFRVVNSLLSFLGVLVWVSVPASVATNFYGHVPTRQYPYAASLSDSDKFMLFWQPDEIKVTFEIHARTTGWLALGISQTGGMRDADIAMSWITEDGTPVLQDRYSWGNTVPSVDKNQDLTLISSERRSDHVILVFSRLRVTCDDDDVAIEPMNMKLIWAVGKFIPEEGADPMKHEYADRGSKTLLLINPPRSLNNGLPADAYSITITAKDVEVPAKPVTRVCVIKRLPKVNKKKHLIMWDPQIHNNNTDIVHNYVGYLAYKQSDLPLDEWQGFCTDKPKFITRSSVIYSWSIGAGKVWMPEEAGFRLGGADHVTDRLEYILMEIEYSNPRLDKGRRDSSGIKLWLTDNLRPHDAGVFQVEASLSRSGDILPPRFDELLLDGYCPAECLAQGFGDKDDITVSMVMTHSHVTGSSVVVRHVRKGNELPVITRERYHDPNFQDYRRLPKPVTVRRLDDLIVECGFDTTKRDSVPSVSELKREEICSAYLMYYPAVPFHHCGSRLTDNQLMAFLKLNVVNGRVTSPGIFQNMTTVQVLSEQKWAYRSVRERFQNNIREGKFQLTCEGTRASNTKLPSDGRVRPFYLPSSPYSDPDSCVSVILRSSGPATVTISCILISIVTSVIYL